MKRFYSFILVLTLFFSVFCCSMPTVYGEKTESENAIYFIVPSRGENKWDNYDTVYCHIWQDGGDEFFSWQTGNEKCERVKGNLWKYDLNLLDKSLRNKNGLEKGKTYAVIFSDSVGNQTYDLYFTDECIGDTVVGTENTKVNPVDGKVICVVAKWKNHPNQYISIDYTQGESNTAKIVNNDPKEDISLSTEMNVVIIGILVFVIIILVVIIVAKQIKDKKKREKK